jgi:hypothetical protein
MNLVMFCFFGPQEDIIYSVVGDTAFEDMPDFIVSEDVTGVNAGTLLFCQPVLL